MNSRERVYLFHYPGMAYAEQWYAKNKKELKRIIREEYHIKRLPNNYAIWQPRKSAFKDDSYIPD